MPQSVDVGALRQQAQRSMVQDGITEIMLGILLTLFGLLFLSRQPTASLAVLLLFALQPAARRLRERHVYPRTGYAKLAQTKDQNPKGILIAALVFLGILLGSMGLMGWVMGWDAGFGLWFSHVFPSFTGVMMAVGPWTAARQYGLKRAYLFAVLFAVGGIALPVAGWATGYRAVALETLTLGLLALVYGIVTFVRFVRTVPVVENADETV